MHEVDAPGVSREASADLVAKAHQFARRARAESTLQGYRKSLRIFAAWCQKHDRAPLPASTETIALFLADVAGHYSFGTVTLFCDAVAFVHRLTGEPFDRTGFRPVLQGIRRTHGSARRRVAPIVVADLRAMLATLPDTLLGKRDRALLLVGFAGALRCGELVGLDVGPPAPPGRGFVELDGEGAHIILLRSKTDQVGKGISKMLPRGGDPCPVEALEAWLAAAHITAGPVFRFLWPSGRLSSKRLTTKRVNLIVKQAVYASARQAGQSEEQARARAHQVSSRSLRAGFVTSAAIANVPTQDIAAHVGWASTRMALTYIRQVDLTTDNPAQRVLVS